MTLYEVRIGSNDPFYVYALNAEQARGQHECLAREGGEVVRVVAVKSEPFPVQSVMQEMECVALRDREVMLQGFIGGVPQ